MASPMICTHGANVSACPVCFRLPKPRLPKPAAATGDETTKLITQGSIVPMGETLIRTTQAAARAATSRSSNSTPSKGPYQSTVGNSPDMYDPAKIWQPPKHESIIDRLPRRNDK